MFDIGKKKYLELTPEEHDALIRDVLEMTRRDQNKLLEEYERRFGKDDNEKTKKVNIPEPKI
jgi:CO dehydrogenase/acetyl-CoA synthase alpha subunit